MNYPPNNPGYPVPQQSGYGAPAPSYPAPSVGPSRLPVYLSVAVVVLGLAAYLASFGPLLTINTDIGPFGGAAFSASGLSYWTVAALLAALLAAVSLLPGPGKSPGGRSYTAVIAVSAVLAVLLVIAQVVNRPAVFAIGWALWLVLVFTVLQSAVAVTALLFESGVLAAPAPRPRYDQYGPYGQPGGYYPGVPGPSQGGQRPGYPAQYGAYPPDTTNTPPSGFPGFGPPSTPEPSAGSAPSPAPGSAQAPASAPDPTQT